MKKIFIALFCCVALASCTFHSGIITPANVIVQEDNFKRIGTIYGSATATYILGIGGNKKLGLVNEAKNDLYTKHKLGANQTITNITYDISRQMILGAFYYKQTCHISADVYEFSRDNNYSENFLNKQIQKDEAKVDSGIEKDEAKVDSEGFVSGPHKNYFKGEIILFKIGANFYKATVSQDSKGENRVAVENFYEKINSNWSLQKNATSKFIPASYIQSKKTP